jgi:seryl-tRNA synthetase
MPVSPQGQALQEVREAKGIVLEKLQKRGDLKILQEAYLHLDQAEDILVLKSIDEKVAALNTVRQKLEKVSKGLKGEIEDLKDVAKKVEMAAKALKLLTDGVEKIV